LFVTLIVVVQLGGFVLVNSVGVSTARQSPNMARDAGDAMIVRSTIDLAHKMGLAVVAEGVDDERALKQLRALRCDMVQGYLLCRPIPPAEITARLRDPVEARRVAAIGGLRLAVR
jgi:predicted signal transduction protein with EAL and GGDEF domain